jgi:hypothetical protein
MCVVKAFLLEFVTASNPFCVRGRFQAHNELAVPGKRMVDERRNEPEVSIDLKYLDLALRRAKFVES